MHAASSACMSTGRCTGQRVPNNNQWGFQAKRQEACLLRPGLGVGLGGGQRGACRAVRHVVHSVRDTCGAVTQLHVHVLLQPAPHALLRPPQRSRDATQAQGAASCWEAVGEGRKQRAIKAELGSRCCMRHLLCAARLRRAAREPAKGAACNL